jgi:hypothetical protein
MAGKSMSLTKLKLERAKMVAELEALKNKIGGLDIAISVLEGHSNASPTQVAVPTGRKPKTKKVVLDMLGEVGVDGLVATEAVERAASRGVTLERGTVSSLLSRFKRDGLVDYDGDRYRLKRVA